MAEILDNNIEENELIVTSAAPKLSALDKLYVRAYLSSLDHIKAHKVVQPSLSQHKSDNIFSRKEAVQFHIALGLQESLEAISLTPDKIVAKLYKEATREGSGSNHAARVTALTVLGKQLGMFQEKKEDITPIINIISYRDSENPVVSMDKKEINNSLEELKEAPTYELSVPPIEYVVHYTED